MGMGKTMSAINYINKADKDIKFLYITPFLTEVDRVIKGCPTKDFKQPGVYGTKLNGIKHLFREGANIASTHRLFRLFDSEIIEMAHSGNYVLIMDEVCDVIEPMEITPHDKETILANHVRVGENNMVEWIDPSYDGKFNEYKKLCDSGCVGLYSNKNLVWLFPVNTFNAFKTIYLLTYLFDAQLQKCYYDYYGVAYTHLYIRGDSVDSYEFTEEVVDYSPICKQFKRLIHICENDRLNKIGELTTSLSSNWYKTNKNTFLIEQLRKNCINWFTHQVKTKSQYNLWTTFKDYRKILSGKGYSKGFLSCNIRATNEYKDRIAVAYLINTYFNPDVVAFFTTNGIPVNNDLHAISELVQFIFRSAIRVGNEIWIYIPSKRMRELLVKWLDSFNDDDGNSS